MAIRRTLLMLAAMIATVLAGAGLVAGAATDDGATRSAVRVVKAPDGQQVALYEESHALIVGNSAYRNGWPPLRGVHADVEAVRDALTLHGFAVEVAEDLDGDKMRSVIASFIHRHGRKANNRLLFYYAGHGHTRTVSYGAQMGYLVPVDAPDPKTDPDGVDERSLNMEEIGTFARRIEAKHVLFLFDSCFSGVVFEAVRAVPEAIQAKTGRPVRQFITAGSAEQQVPDRSIFRQQLVAALRGEEGLGHDGYLTASELGQFLERSVTNYSRRAQTPEYGKMRDPRLDKGDFVFVMPRREEPKPVAVTPTVPAISGGVAPVVAPAQAAIDEDAMMCRRLENSQQLADFEGYLADFPSGKCARFARRQLEALKRAQTPPAVPVQPAPVQIAVVAPSSPPPREPMIPTEAGRVFRDCPECPEMVVVPAGSFTMGSPANEPERQSYEGPQHRVTIARPFAVGKFAVTFAEWDACVADGGCNGYQPADQGWGRGRRPVINVSWNDAQAYIQWLNGKVRAVQTVSTGGSGPYRLLSEAEREYVTRAGTTTPFWWGSTITTAQANYDGNGVYNGGKKGEYRQRTLEVDAFQANPFGLYQVHGNVWEWVQDCWHGNYDGAPTDGSAWTTGGGNCGRVVRGGSWSLNPSWLRSANRHFSSPDYRNLNVGFRAARTLNPGS